MKRERMEEKPQKPITAFPPCQRKDYRGQGHRAALCCGCQGISNVTGGPGGDSVSNNVLGLLKTFSTSLLPAESTLAIQGPFAPEYWCGSNLQHSHRATRMEVKHLGYPSPSRGSSVNETAPLFIQTGSGGHHHFVLLLRVKVQQIAPCWNVPGGKLASEDSPGAYVPQSTHLQPIYLFANFSCSAVCRQRGDEPQNLDLPHWHWAIPHWHFSTGWLFRLCMYLRSDCLCPTSAKLLYLHLHNKEMIHPFMAISMIHWWSSTRGYDILFAFKERNLRFTMAEAGLPILP